MPEQLAVLIVAGLPETARSLSAALEEAGFDVLWVRADSLERFMVAFEERDWDLVLCEDRLGDLDALDVVEEAQRRDPPVPVLAVLDAFSGERVARLFRAGASDCITRGDPGEVGRAVPRWFEKTASTRSRQAAAEESIQYRTYLEDLVTSRTEEARRANIRLAAEVDLHRITVRALRASEESFRMLAENAPCAIVRVGSDFSIVYANPSSEDFTGVAPSEVIGKSIQEGGLPEALGADVLEMLKEVFRSGNRIERKVRAGSDEQQRVFDIVIVPERMDKGQVGTGLMMVHDITETERAREILELDKSQALEAVDAKTTELLRAQLELAEARRLSDIGTLAATIAHELRNPLATVQTAVYNVKKKRVNKAIDKHLANIDKKILESNQIINNLLNYSRLKQPRLAETDVSKLLSDHLAAARQRFPKRRVRVTKRIGSIRGMHFPMDAGQMGEVFANILNNAYDALGDSGGGITVTARREEGNGNLLISFSDNGRGMGGPELERALEPFFTTKSKGTGLGLTICRDIVRLHGGDLAINSRLGEGTTVTITLPVM
jgi:PAS domain S-box-containing protein